jgi:DNA-binding NtrC family response regulator
MMKKIIFVDDDSNLVSGLKRSMRSMSDVWDMMFFTDPDEAYMEYAANGADVIVSDYRMPLLNGLELLKKVRTVSNETVFIILTGQVDESVQKELKSKTDAYLLKPCTPEEIINVITKAVG